MLLDTSGILCLLHEAETFHDAAQTFYEAADRRVTHSYVLAEWITLAHARGVPRALALDFASDLLRDSEVEIEWVGHDLHRAAVVLLKARPDKSYSLCDAVSFLLMRRTRIHEALTTDRHFEQEGFRRLLV